jgi:hypothetical protein
VSIATTPKPPHGYREILAHYGNPANARGKLDPDWYRQNMVSLELPYPMVLAGARNHPVLRVQVHRRVKAALEAALWNVWNAARLKVKARDGYDKDTAYYDVATTEILREMHLDIFGGSFCFRPKRSSSHDLSVHSFGAAIDIDPGHNAQGSHGDMPAWVVDAFEAAGWTWGGGFSKRDPMHFQFASGY